MFQIVAFSYKTLENNSLQKTLCLYYHNLFRINASSAELDTFLSVGAMHKKKKIIPKTALLALLAACQAFVLFFAAER